MDGVPVARKILPGQVSLYITLPPKSKEENSEERPLNEAVPFINRARVSLSSGRRWSVRRKKTSGGMTRTGRTSSRSTGARCRMTGPRNRSNGTGRNRSLATETGPNRNSGTGRARNSGASLTWKRNRNRKESSAWNRSRCGDYTSGPGCRTMKTWRARHNFPTARSRTGSLRNPRRTAAGPYRNGPFRPGAG
jgi:hypothetical protein